MNQIIVVLVAIVAIASKTSALELKCLNSTSHKLVPSSETSLKGECARYNSLSCCDTALADSVHAKTYFNWNHCYRVSSKCRRRFLLESCSYQCDPYMAQWIVKDNKSIRRKERLFELPICKTDCHDWFNDCQNDYTCQSNWYKGFQWKNGINQCREFDKCIKIKDMFKSAEDFCSRIFDESFKVAPDDKNCFTFSFDKDKPNPNKLVAEYYENNGL